MGNLMSLIGCRNVSNTKVTVTVQDLLDFGTDNILSILNSLISLHLAKQRPYG